MNSQQVIEQIRRLYSELAIPSNLQLHMFRAASVAMLICEHWKGTPLEKEDIIASLLLHDVGNIVKFNWQRRELYAKDVLLNLDFWKQKQSEIIAKYSSDDHEVTLKLLENYEISPRIIQLITEHESLKNETIASGTDMNVKVCCYADHRAGPKGIVSLSERYEEAEKRYGGPVPGVKTGSGKIKNAAFIIENQVLAQTDLAPEDITDAAIEKYLQILMKKS